MAKIRSNRVKTELILRGGLTEECFTTKNHTSGGNYVTVRLELPAGPSEAELEAQRKLDAERLAAEKRAEQERLAAEKRKAEEARRAAEQAEAERLAAEQAERERAEAARLAAEAEAAKAKPYTFAVRANLLRWVTLTPDVGVEWCISRSVGLAVDGSWTSWSWNDKDRRYALWEVAPEVRWYLGEKKAWYVGAMFKAGAFNYKLSETGRQGDLLGCGVTGGYVLPLSKALSLDFSLGMGYLNADHDKYEVIDGVRVRRGNETKSWWGPIDAGVTLEWKLF